MRWEMLCGEQDVAVFVGCFGTDEFSASALTGRFVPSAWMPWTSPFIYCEDIPSLKIIPTSAERGFTDHPVKCRMSEVLFQDFTESFH